MCSLPYKESLPKEHGITRLIYSFHLYRIHISSTNLQLLHSMISSLPKMVRDFPLAKQNAHRLCHSNRALSLETIEMVIIIFFDTIAQRLTVVLSIFNICWLNRFFGFSLHNPLFLFNELIQLITYPIGVTSLLQIPMLRTHTTQHSSIHPSRCRLYPEHSGLKIPLSSNRFLLLPAAGMFRNGFLF